MCCLAEMAYSFYRSRNTESISFSKRAIKTHPREPGLKSVYVSYGNALDGIGKTDKSVDIYNEGIRIFPEYYLYFNQGISQQELNKTEEALMSFQKSATLNPTHAGSHNALGHVLIQSESYSLLTGLCRFLV